MSQNLANHKNMVAFQEKEESNTSITKFVNFSNG